MKIKLTEEQEIAVESVVNWFHFEKTKKKKFVLAGLAGTGKSSILPFIIKKIDLTDVNVACVAYTGMASLVMNRKGMKNAQTIHSLIYEMQTVIDNEGNVSKEFVKRNYINHDIKLIICDEASMVSVKIQNDLESFRIPVLYIGDHGQLPPISNASSNILLKPDIKLETIHRQALENPIISLAHMAREGNHIPYGKYGDNVLKIRLENLKESSMVSADQLLCGLNSTRRTINKQFREIYGYKGLYPNKNDKLICLNNNWKKGLINGMTGICEEYIIKQRKLSFYNEINEWKDLIIDPIIFEGGKAEYVKNVDQFDYGYCVTVHKFQGSQADKIILFDEKMNNDVDYYAKWLYTGITRAVEKLIIVS